MSGGTIKSGNLQVGQDGTASNNFTWYQPAVADGTVRLGVGVAGATTSDVITVNSSSNVGVGTTSPASKLNLQGSSLDYITFSTSGTNKAYVGVDNGTPELVVGAAAGDLVIRSNQKTWFGLSGGGVAAVIDSSGNVLINTTTAPSAGAKFNVLGGTQTSDSTGNVQKITRCFTYTFAAAGTKNIQFTVADSCSYAIEVTMSSTYSAANYGGAMKTVFGGSMNNSSTSLYGSGQTAMYSVGLMSTAYAFGTQTKPSNTALNIPITFSGTPSSPVYIVVELYGTVNGITNIAIV